MYVCMYVCIIYNIYRYDFVLVFHFNCVTIMYSCTNSNIGLRYLSVLQRIGDLQSTLKDKILLKTCRPNIIGTSRSVIYAQTSWPVDRYFSTSLLTRHTRLTECIGLSDFFYISANFCRSSVVNQNYLSHHYVSRWNNLHE